MVLQHVTCLGHYTNLDVRLKVDDWALRAKPRPQTWAWCCSDWPEAVITALYRPPVWRRLT